MDVQHAARDIAPRITELRHALHRHPEIGLDLPRTQARVLSELADLPLEIRRGDGCSSVTAVLRGTHPDRPAAAPAVLLRADMDALPIAEDTGEAFASVEPGAMHACGHDLHTAMLAGAARVLAGHRAELPGDVVLMFQPGEEAHDGARLMIAEGVLDAAGPRVAAAFALHVFANTYPAHALFSRPGAMFAAADGLRVTVRGRGGHSSAPYRAVDPVPIAAEMVLALQSFTTRRFDVFDPIVLGIGGIRGGDLAAPNVIPEAVEFTAAVRFWSEAARTRFHDGVAGLLDGIAAAHGAAVEVAHEPGYPVTVTDPAETAFAATTLRDVFGTDRFTELADPLAASEDFSRVLAAVPGSYIGLGAAVAGADPATLPDNHSAFARFDDAVLPTGVAAYAALAHAKLRQLAGVAAPPAAESTSP